MSSPSNNPSLPPSSSSPSAARRLSLSAICNPPTSRKNVEMTSGRVQSGSLSPGSRQSLDSGDRSSTPRSLSLNAEDESVMIAVKALDDMRSGASSTHASSSSPPSQQSTSPQLRSSTSTLSNETQALIVSSDEHAPAQFVTRVSGLPIVNTALKAYEQSKASSRVVKYGAEMMESSMRSISKPVINRLPVNQLDEFACRQLDRFGKRNNPCPSTGDQDVNFSDTSESSVLQGEQSACSSSGRMSRARFVVGEGQEDDREEGSSNSQAISSRSRWHSLLYEAGGISAAVSAESMRSLKYCLQWLQYATDHTDAQILILRNFIASINEHEEEDTDRPIAAAQMQTLTNVKRDVVSTIRQVVDVMSKYAGGALPEPARSKVRQFILLLPQRWASTAHRHGATQPGRRHRRTGSASDLASAASTAPSTPAQSPRMSTRGLQGGHEGLHRQTTAARPTAGSAAQAAQRILTLATESLDMMRNVTGIFKESLERADVWVDRLRTVGIQRRQNEDGTLRVEENNGI